MAFTASHTAPIPAYPLSWPPMVPRTEEPRKSAFIQPTVVKAFKAIRAELGRMGAKDVVVSTNFPLNKDGTPRAGNVSLEDHGAAVYWTLHGRPYCLPCDRWLRLAENLHAIACTIRNLRANERWGAIRIEQAFAGMLALPPGDGSAPMLGSLAPVDWRKVLGGEWPKGLSNSDLLGIARSRYRALMKMVHPNSPGAVVDVTRSAELGAAKEAAEKELA